MDPDDPTTRDVDPDEPVGDGAAESRYDEWPIADERHRDAQYLGSTAGGTPFYHHGGTVFRGEPDAENREIAPDADSKRELAADEKLGDVVAEIGDSLGWESLSAFAEDHLSRDEGAEDGRGVDSKPGR